jgi:hypothetical protein
VSNGTGPGAVNLSVAANSSTTSLSGIITIANNAATVTEAGAPCSYTVSPMSVSLGTSGGSATAAINAPSGCGWTASTTASWVALAATSGLGSQSLGYSVAPNTSSSPRTATLNVAGKNVTVSQGGVGVACTYTLSSTSASFTYQGGKGAVTLTTANGCPWSVTDSANWLSVSPTSGTGSATLSYTLTKDNGTSRNATITVGGQTMSITEGGRKDK